LDIIDEVHKHTLTVELTGKTLASSGFHPNEMLSSLRTEGLMISNPNKIPLTKDSITKKERLYQHIQTFFKIQNPTAQHIDTLMMIFYFISELESKPDSTNPIVQQQGYQKSECTK